MKKSRKPDEAVYLWWWQWHRLPSPLCPSHPQRSSSTELFVYLWDSCTGKQGFSFIVIWYIFKLHCKDVSAVLLGYFNFDVDVVISKAIATDSSNSLPWQADPLVCLDACRDLKTNPVNCYTECVWNVAQSCCYSGNKSFYLQINSEFHIGPVFSLCRPGWLAPRIRKGQSGCLRRPSWIWDFFGPGHNHTAIPLKRLRRKPFWKVWLWD